MVSWIVYSLRLEGSNWVAAACTLNVPAGTVDAFSYVKAEYTKHGAYTFVHTEPLDAVNRARIYDSSEDLLDFLFATYPTALNHAMSWLITTSKEKITVEGTQTGRLPGPKKPEPQVPPEVWAKPREDVDYMAAVRAMCGKGE